MESHYGFTNPYVVCREPVSALTLLSTAQQRTRGDDSALYRVILTMIDTIVYLNDESSRLLEMCSHTVFQELIESPCN